MTDPLTGGCLCGGVRYAVAGEVYVPRYCHCSLCRKFTGGAASAIASALADEFQLTAGADLVRVFRHEDRKEYVFCSTCGSSLFSVFKWTTPLEGMVNIRMGTFDGDPGVRPEFHFFVGSKAPWHEITDDRPQFEDRPG